MLGYETEGGRGDLASKRRLSGHGSPSHPCIFFGRGGLWLEDTSSGIGGASLSLVDNQDVFLGSGGGCHPLRILRLYPASFARAGSTHDRRNTRVSL